MAGSRTHITIMVPAMKALHSPMFCNPWISCALYVAVAAIRFSPDRRIERIEAA